MAIWISWSIDIRRSLNTRDSFPRRKFTNRAPTSCSPGPILSPPTISFELHAKMAEEIDLEKCNFRNFWSSVTLDWVEVTLVRICDRGLPTHQIKWKSEKLFVDACTDERTPQLQSTRSSVGDDLRVETRHPMEGYLWPPYVIGQAIYIFSFCCLFFLFSSPNLSGRKLDVCHTSSHGVALVRI